MRTLAFLALATVLLGGCAASDAPRRPKPYHTIRVLPREGDDYLLLNHRGRPITENELARRYRVTTGFTDLDDVNRHRRLPLAITSGLTLPIPIALLTFGIVKASEPRELDNNTPVGFDMIAITAGAVGTIVLGVAFAAATADPDGSIENHDLSREDAETYVRIYNERLKDTDSHAP